jgi:hypothetical protein
MSSHHFVKEGQEPALLVYEPASFSVASGLLEWAPLVMVTETALECVLSWGVKVDVVFAGSANSGQLHQRLEPQFPYDLVTCPGDLLACGLSWLRDYGHRAVNILAHEPSKLFPLITPFVGVIEIVVLEPGRRWMHVQDAFSKWTPENRSFRVAAAENQLIDYEGLSESNGVYRSLREGFVSLSSNKAFWVGEEV